MMFIVKLGGSVITDKRKKEYFRETIMNQLATEIQQAQQPLILIHGAGSFGHILAKQYQLHEGKKNNNQLHGFAQTQQKVQFLNTLVLQTLHAHHIPAISLPPHTFLALDNHKITTADYTILNAYMQQGFMPVLYGDVALDKTHGFSICSGDLLVQALTQHVKPKKVIFVIDEDGLYTANPKLNSSATLITETTAKKLNELTTAADHHADVTKGMEGKINTIQQVAYMGIPTSIVNGNKPNRLYNILIGKETICTNIQ